MYGVILGRGKDWNSGELKPYDWKGNVTLLKPYNPISREDTYFVSISNPEEMYQWQEGFYLDEEIMLTTKCLIEW